ncbi:MAG: hypothetical protein ACKOPQ_15360 [Novosphingobium sp.]
MKSLLSLAAAVSALGLALPASAATGLDCIDGGYSAADQAVLNGFDGKFTYQGADNAALTKAAVGVMAVRADACTAEKKWTLNAKRYATMHKLAVHMERAMRANGLFNAAQLTKLDALMTGSSGDVVRAALAPAVRAQLLGQPAPAQDNGQLTAVGLAIMSSGLPTDAKNGDFIGQLIGARLLNEIASELFAAE